MMAPRPFRRGRPAPVTGGTPVIPGFSDLTRIGAGGFSLVYRARQDALGRDVALKVLNVNLSEPRAAERFRRECRTAGSLSDHPNIVTVHDAGVAPDGRPWLAMELCEEQSLADRIRIQGPLPPDEVLRIGIKIAGALDAAHRAGVLHRDLKPENILLTRSGEPALADFGIAVVAEHREGAFTQAFSVCHAAPEVLEGADPSPAADVYGLGSALWMLLVGRPPFEEQEGEGVLPFLRRVTTEPVPRIGRGDVPPEVEAALGDTLAKDPAGRPRSAAELADVLSDLERRLGLVGRQAAARSSSGFLPPIGSTPDTVIRQRVEVEKPAAAPVVQAPPRRWLVWLIPASAGALVITAAGVYATQGGTDPEPPPSTTVASPPPTSGPGGAAPPTTALDLPAPTGVQATVSSPSTVEVTWAPPAVGRPAHTVTTEPAVGAGPQTVQAGQTSATVRGLSTASTAYCFVVSAVYLLRDGTAKVVSADPVCTTP